MLSLVIGLLILEKVILKFVDVFFLLLRNYLPLKKSGANLESPLPKDDFCQIWLKLAQWFGEEDENMKSLRQQRQRG